MNNIINELNNLKILQKSIDFIEDIPEDIYNNYFHKLVQDELFIDKHRWYELSISVYEYNDLYIGVKHISNVYSEKSSVDDMYHTLHFYEMEPIQVTTFNFKKNEESK